MRFKRTTTYNVNDSRYERWDRHIVANGVESRCTTIVNLMFANPIPMAARDVLRHLPAGYSKTDIFYATRVLEKAGIIIPHFEGRRRSRCKAVLFTLVERGRLLWLRTRQAIERERRANARARPRLRLIQGGRAAA